MDPKISVIIPLYNCEKYIAKCIKSILNNTFTYFEVIIINDGSTDQSVKIIVDTISNDERFTIINQENHGIGYSRNKGIFILAVFNFECFIFIICIIYFYGQIIF